MDPALMLSIADQFEAHSGGADLWFAESSAANDPLLPANTQCPHCGGKKFTRSRDILDVWFDSGVSYAAVLEKKMGLKLPCQLYLEGSDQHRGWFHSSLLAALASREQPPYQAVLTHGFVVDGSGKKMSKSLGNYINADEAVKKRGAELLRLWVASEDYQNDIRVSEEILQRITESYRRIRNTARFLLGNLADFTPSKDSLPYVQMSEVDRYLLSRLSDLIKTGTTSYLSYDFHHLVQALHQFCVVDLSSFYLDVTKDCLYTDPADSRERRSAQTAIFLVVEAMARLMAPILSFTGEEVWQHIPEAKAKQRSVFLAGLPIADPEWQQNALAERWQQLLTVRSAVLKELEKARSAKTIGSSLEADVELHGKEPWGALLASFGPALASLFIVSEVRLVGPQSPGLVESESIPGVKIRVVPASGRKCERCWVYKKDLGSDSQHPTLCGRCVRAVKS